MLHVDPRLATGTIGITPGPVNAAADEFHLTIRGKGGHGAYPHKAVDVIPCAAATVLALQNIVARETDPLASIVVTVGTIEGGYRNNVIADRVFMTGTVRTHDPAIRETAEGKLRRIVDGVAAAYGARARPRDDLRLSAGRERRRARRGVRRVRARRRGSRSSGPRRRWAARISRTSRSASPA